MTEGSEQILADAQRLEDAEEDARKGLWLIEGSHGDVVIVEAVTGPGAVSVAKMLDICPTGDLSGCGPIHRDAWPREYWYRLLSEEDVAEMESRVPADLP